MPIGLIANGDSGQSVTDKLNALITFANASPATVISGKIQNTFSSTNNTTLIAVTELDIAVEANSIYMLDYSIHGTKTGVSTKVGNINYIFSIPANVIASRQTAYVTDNITEQSFVGTMDTLFPNNTAGTTNTAFSIEISAMIKTGTDAGTIQFQFRENVTNGTTALFLGGVRAIKL